MAYPQAEVFWQIPHHQTNKITNAWQNLMPRGWGGWARLEFTEAW